MTSPTRSRSHGRAIYLAIMTLVAAAILASIAFAPDWTNIITPIGYFASTMPVGVVILGRYWVRSPEMSMTQAAGALIVAPAVATSITLTESNPLIGGVVVTGVAAVTVLILLAAASNVEERS